jgi:hypothetical protein
MRVHTNYYCCAADTASLRCAVCVCGKFMIIILLDLLLLVLAHMRSHGAVRGSLCILGISIAANFSLRAAAVYL